MSKLVEGHAIGIALATDAYTFEYTVAAQLLQHQRRVDFASLHRKVTWKLVEYALLTFFS